MRKIRHKKPEAELDITSFMNLMIILVPVLLMSMAFAHITVLDLRLPDAGPGSSEDKEKKQLELVIRKDYIDVNYPVGVLLKRVENTEEGYDFEMLTTVLKEVKRKLKEQGVEKRDILILAEPGTDYQTLVGTMDAVRSFQTVLVASVVWAELFPDIALGDAPPAAKGS